jgi:hypothetical protein
MSSQILSGNGTTTRAEFTNNTSQNMRLVINFMYADPNGEISITWEGTGFRNTVSGGNLEAIGKNMASASGFYGDWGFFGFLPFGWWKKIQQTFAPTANLDTQNMAVRYPGASTTVDLDFPRKGWKRFFREGSTTDIAVFSFSMALPTEIFLAPGQKFNAVCGAFNIIALTEGSP